MSGPGRQFHEMDSWSFCSHRVGNNQPVGSRVDRDDQGLRLQDGWQTLWRTRQDPDRGMSQRRVPKEQQAVDPDIGAGFKSRPPAVGGL